MGTRPTRLAPIPLDCRPDAEVVRPMWDSLMQSPEQDRIMHLALDIYFRVVQRYLITQTGVPMTMIGQLFGKRWTTVLKHCGLRFASLTDFVVGLSASDTVPLAYSYEVETSRTVVHMQTAIDTFMTRLRRGEELPDILEFFAGRVKGPVLTEFGKQLAYAPWNIEELSAANNAAKAAAAAQAVDTAQKIDKPAQAPVKFGESDLPVGLVPNSSTDETPPETP